MTSIANINTLTLSSGTANEIVLDAPSNDTLDFADSGGADVDLTGLNVLTLSGSFNQGAPMTGHSMAIVCERQSITAGEYGSWGHGVNNSVGGIVMPLDGEIVSATVATSSSATAQWTIYNTTVSTGVTLSVSAGTQDSVSPGTSFSANNYLQVSCDSGSAATTSYIFTIFIRFHI